MSLYQRLIDGTLFLSREYGRFDKGCLILMQGMLDKGSLYLFPNTLIGGMKSMKNERNRGMFFGSWTGESIPEAAEVYIGDSTGVTACTVDASAFGKGVSSVSGEYTFLYDGTSWTRNGDAVADLKTAYGLTTTGEAAENDILVVNYTAASGAWEALGKDNDDMSKELNPDTETGKNVLGEVRFTHSGYEPEVSVDPYYIDPARKMYKRLMRIAHEESYSESDCVGFFAEAYFETANKLTKKMTGHCYVRQAWYVPQSVGGDTSGYAIPVNITPFGPMTKKKIVYDMTTNEATITDIV